MSKTEEKQAYYPSVEANPDFVALEADILAFWKREGIFQQSVEKNRGTGEAYVFYDGPPFANGLPHYGHLLTGYVKDLVARYQTMRGKVVERRFGWDCHGLPAEMGAEKELGISGRQAIMEYGIGKFNDHCRESVMKYASEWERYVDRQGRWVDFKNDYKTMDKDFMESVLWAFSELYKKGLIYESYRVMPYSWAAETPLSNFETRLDNATREREDKAITVAFELDEVPEWVRRQIEHYKKTKSSTDEILNPNFNPKNIYLLAWTTTPWTLPSNLALAVNRDTSFRAYYKDENLYFASSDWVRHNEDQASEFKEFFAIDEITHLSDDGSPAASHIEIDGKDLIGLTYKPLFPYFAHLKQGKPSPLEGEGWVGGQTPPPSPLPQGEGESFAKRGYPEYATDYAKELRNNPTDAEKKLWSALKSEQLGYKFRRQQPIGNYIVDFYNADKRLVLEVDGGQHAENTKDEERSKWLEAQGLKVLRFWNNEVLQNIDGVLTVIAEALKNTPHAVSSETAAPPQGGSSYGAFRILDGSDFIEEGSGTGVVHLAPGFGEDDQKCCEKNGISIVCPVDDKGCYTEEVSGFRFQVSGEEQAGTQNPTPDTLHLTGLNVIADTRKDEGEPYSDQQLQKYGLANLRIINWLKQQGKLIKQEDFKHNYPHCWRTDTPIIYRALPSWYVKVSAFKDRAVELNRNIHWIPEHTRDGAMGHMLGSAPDWSISRNRFWGCPIPVWKSPSGKIKVFGSIAEIEDAWNKGEASRPSEPSASGASPIAQASSAEQGHKKITDLHRPFIDEIVIQEDGEEYRRVEEVLDCWFESGSMPYAQLHYPFENAEKFKANYPGDFITEYIGQTRGWFNTLIMLATALFDEEPFKNCICHGVVIDEETGLKYSKRLKNYKDPMEVFDTFGADALRWLMVSSGVMRGHDLGVDPEGKFIRDVVRLNIKPIWNAYNFFTLYANADGVKAEFDTGSMNEMDRYILAKCAAMVEGIQTALDGYDTPAACEAVTKFVEVLNNWYIRRSRPRFWGAEMNADKQAAYNTLYTVLHTLCRAAAPLLPFTLEAVYRGLCSPLAGERASADYTSGRPMAGASGNNQARAVGGNSAVVSPPTKTADAVSTPPQGGSSPSVSVHLQDFPSELLGYRTKDDQLAHAMDFVRDVCNAALSVRNKTNIRVRQPISSLKIIADGSHLKSLINTPQANYFFALIQDETNIKDVALSGDADDLKQAAELKLAVNFPILGKRLPEKMKQVIPASKKGEWKRREDGKIEIAGAVLEPEEFSLKLEPKPEFKDNSQPLSTNDALVVLDLTLTPELIAEGVARDVVRMVQESRKKADLHISDKISLIITAPESVQNAVSGFTDYIAGQVLAESVRVGSDAAEFSFEHELEGEKVVIAFSKVSGSGFQVPEKETTDTQHLTPETLGKAI